MPKQISDTQDATTRPARLIEVMDASLLHGQLHPLVAQIKNLEPGKVIKLSPRLDEKERAALIWRCRFAGFKIKTRQTPEASFVWFHCAAPPPPSVKARRPTAGGQ